MTLVLRRIAVSAVGLVVTLGTLIGGVGPAHAADFTPDTWAYCYYTKPWSNDAYAITYAGIYARPYSNSYRTQCHDRYVSTGDKAGWPAGLVLNIARNINWNSACQITYPKSRYGRTYYAYFISPSGTYVCRAG